MLFCGKVTNGRDGQETEPLRFTGTKVQSFNFSATAIIDGNLAMGLPA